MNNSNEQYENELRNLKESNIQLGNLTHYNSVAKQYPLIFKKAEELKNQHNFKRIAEALYWIMNDIKEFPHCPYHTHPKCNDRPLFVSYNQGYRKACPFCGRANPDIIQKQKEGCLKKYGVENVMLIKEIKDKQSTKLKITHEKYGFGTQYFKDKMVEKYGVDNPSKNDVLLQKSKENKAKVLSDPIKKSEITNKKKKTEIEKYGCLYVQTQECHYKTLMAHNNADWFKNYVKELRDYLKEYNIEFLENITWEKNSYKWKCLKCGRIYDKPNELITLHDIRNKKVYFCKDCYKIPGGASISEYEVGHFIESQIPNIKIEHNRRDLIPNNYKEIDLWFPDYNIGIEFCGMLYHSTFPYGLNGKGLSPDYHQSKFYSCHNSNINLITIFENEWMAITNRIRIRKRLLEYFNIYDIDTNCVYIQDIDINECIQFLHTNRYWTQFLNANTKCKAIYNEHDIIIAVLINIKNNDYIIYKINGVLINNFKEFIINKNINIIQDNRYPLKFKNFEHKYETFQWEYHDGWCTDIYKEYPDKSTKIRKINDCGYSHIIF